MHAQAAEADSGVSDERRVIQEKIREVLQFLIYNVLLCILCVSVMTVTWLHHESGIKASAASLSEIQAIAEECLASDPRNDQTMNTARVCLADIQQKSKKAVEAVKALGEASIPLVFTMIFMTCWITLIVAGLHVYLRNRKHLRKIKAKMRAEASSSVLI